MLIPHSTTVTGSQALTLLESLIPTLGLDPAQEIGLRRAVDELRDFAEGPALDELREAQEEITRKECEDAHEIELEELAKVHATDLAEAREEAHAAGYDLGATDCEGAIRELMIEQPRYCELVHAMDDIDDMVYRFRTSREIAEKRAERERIEREERAAQAERERFTAKKRAPVHKKGRK